VSNPRFLTTAEHERRMGDLAHEYEKKLDALRVELRALQLELEVAERSTAAKQPPPTQQQPSPKHR